MVNKRVKDNSAVCRSDGEADLSSQSVARRKAAVGPDPTNRPADRGSSPATLRDVARRAGVSLATASYALGSGRRSVGEETRRRVVQAADDLGYRRGPRGRRPTRRLVVGVVVPDATNSFFAETLRSLERMLQGEGHAAVIASSGDDPDREEDLLRYLAGKVDALVVAPAGPLSVREQALSARVPIVVMDRDGAAPELPSVRLDNEASARRATRVLLESGHRRVAIVNGPLRVSSARERLAGYRSALAEIGVEEVADLVRCGEFTYDFGREAVRDLLRLPAPPDAIFSASAILTAGVLSALREHRLRWPDDVAVVGFGDAVWASLVEPAVTVVEQPTAELGATAGRLALAAVRRVTAPQHLVLASRLVVRDSHWLGGSGLPRREEPSVEPWPSVAADDRRGERDQRGERADPIASAGVGKLVAALSTRPEAGGARVGEAGVDR